MDSCYSTFISSRKTTVILTICVVSMISLFACSEQSRREEVGEDLSEEETTGRALTVQTTCLGATVYDVESKITVPIEDGLSALDGMIEMRSISKPGISSVVLEFEPDVDLDRAIVAVRAKLDSVVLPDDSKRPVILRHDVDTSPVITLFVLGNVDRISWVSKLLRDKYLQNIKGVSEVRLVGGRDREIQIILDPYKLRAFGLNEEDILIALRSVKATEQESIQDQAEKEYAAKVIDEFSWFEIANIDDISIRIRDVGWVNYVEKVPTLRCRLRWFRDEPGIIRTTGEDCQTVAMQIYKDSDADPETVVREIGEKLGEIKSQIPASVEIWTYDAVKGISRMKGDERIIIRTVAPPDFRRGNIDGLAISAETFLERHHGCSYIYTLITDNPGEEKIAHFFVGLADSEFRQQIMESVSEFFSQIPGLVVIEVRDSPDHLGRLPLNFSLKGDDLDMLMRYANRITTQLAQDPGLLNVRTSSSFEETIEFHLEQDRLAQLGVSSSSVDTVIRCFLAGVYVTKLDIGEEHIDLRLFIGNPEDTRDLSDLRRLTVYSDTGEKVPLDSLVSILRGRGPTNIRRCNGKREVLIYCDPAPGTSLQEAAEIIRRVTKKLELPPGCEFEPVGQTKRQLREF